VLAVFAVACGDDGAPLGPIDAGPLDAFEPPWWTPEPGEAANWDIQLVAPFNVVASARAMYDLDLWDVTTAETITYDDSSTVTVPAGSLAGKIAELQAAGGIVVCHVDLGAIALDDPDASKFMGFEVTPPDRPTAPTVGSVIGWSVVGDPNKRYLDLRTASRPLWEAIMFKRLDLAKRLGCDGIDAAWMDQIDPGFPLVMSGADNDLTNYFREVVGQLHQRELSAGLRVVSMVGKTLSDGFVESYDFAIDERCAEFKDCDFVRRFAQERKAIFGLDYETDGVTDRDLDGEPDGISFASACTRMNLPMDWIHKDADAAFRPSSSYHKRQSECL